MQIEGRTIVLTGGTSGIGRALVDQLAPRCRLIVIARPSHRAETLRTAHPGITLINADLSRPDQMEDAAQAVLATGPVHGLIHSAAVQNTAALAAPDFDLPAMHDEIALNFTAACHLTARLLPQMLTLPEGFVMTLNSGLGLVPKTGSAVYCGTKGGLDVFTRGLRNELAGTGVRALQTFLPLVDTPMTAGRGSGKLAPETVARRIIRAIETDRPDTDIGKVKLLRLIDRLMPSLAAQIMRGT